MTRTLLIIAGAAFVLALATLGGAAAIGGRDLAANGWEWTFPGHGDGGDETIRFERDDSPRQADATRTLDWTGGTSIEARTPIDLTYVQGPEAKVVITGPQALIDRIIIDGGVIGFNNDGDRSERVTFSLRDGDFDAWSDQDRLRVTVTAPGVNRFDLRGSGDLTIQAYDQDSLTIDVAGSSDVTAEGRVKTLSLDIAGSGDADLSRLETTDATVAISGSGDASIAPTGRADLSVSGSGDIDLTTRPTTLNQRVSGSGDISQR